MKITDDNVQELKAQYPELYKVTRKDSDYVFHLPTLKEWRDARRKDSTFSSNDKLVRSCLVFPTPKDLTDAEKSDAYLVEVLGRKLIGYLIEDDDGDEGTQVTFEDGSLGFKISRKKVLYTFRSPSRSEWKRISGMIGSDNLGALEYLVNQCKIGLKDTELMEIMEKDVAFIEVVGGPFIKMVAEDLMAAEGKRI